MTSCAFWLSRSPVGSSAQTIAGFATTFAQLIVEIGLVVRSGGVTCGHYLLTAATRVARPSLEQRRVAVLLADQVGTLVAGGGPGYEAQDAP